MARRDGSGWGARPWLIVMVALVVFFVTLRSAPVAATLKYGDVQFSGSFTTQNLIRTPDIDKVQFVMNRNTAYLRMDWDWYKKGKLAEMLEIPFLRESKFFLLYRGVYDGFWDLAPNDLQRGISRFDDLVGGPIEGNRIGTIRKNCDPQTQNCLREGSYSRTDTDRGNISRENELREVYVDLKFKDVPVSLRIGRQQIIWGEADQFRMMDIWNPLDLRWHLQQEPFTEIREPLWMIKGLWDMPVIELPLLGAISNTFLEVVWNPFDYKPGVIPAFQPRPWAAAFPHPLRQGQISVVSPELASFASPDFNLNGTTFTKGDFQKNPAEASGIGARFHTVTEQGFEFTTNYLYHRGRGIGAAASNSFAVRFMPNGTNQVNCNPGEPNCAFNVDLAAPLQAPPTDGTPDQFYRDSTGGPAYFGEIASRAVVRRAYVNAEIIHPYVHIFGFTANYAEMDYTQAVFRMETAYALDIPYISASQEGNHIDEVTGETIPEKRTVRQRVFVKGSQDALVRLFPGIEKRDVWAIMLGFDRPTWIRPLNKKTTWFLTGQFFLSFIPSGVSSLRGSTVTASENPYFAPTNPELFGDAIIGAGGVGQWLNGEFAGTTERTQDNTFLGVNEDKVHKWESLITFAAFSFYKGGSIMPFVAVATDPINGSTLLQPHVQYFFTNNFFMRVGGKAYFNWGGHNGVTQDPWGAGGFNNRRDEVDLRFTLQF